jgi:hypothetical protein
MFVEAAEVGVALWHERKAIKRLLTRIKNRIRFGHLKIIIFGGGGTGKSTLGQLFSGQLGREAASKSYIESIKTEEYKLQGDLVGTLLAPPGQEHRVLHTWPQLFRELIGGKSSGIINVVADGYHSFQGLSFKEHRLFEEHMSQDDFMQAYLLDRQNRELELLDEIVPPLKVTKGRIWVLTLVNKQDLWWAERNSVQQHYVHGEYHDRIESVLSHKGNENFRHDYLSASLVVSNFRTESGETLALTAAGYDQAVRLANLDNFLTAVDQLAKS